MTKTDIVNSLAESMKLSKAQSKRIVDHVLEDIETALANGENVQLTGFGSFSRVSKPKRTVQLTGIVKKNTKKKNVVVPEHFAVRFRTGEGLKSRLNSKK